MSSGRHSATRRHRRWPFVVVGAVVVLVLAGAGSAFAAYRYDEANRDRILPGVTVAGIDVGGMTRDDAVRAVEGEAQGWLDQPVTISARGRTWDATPAELGVHADPAAAVAAALAVTDEYGWTSRTVLRLTGGSADRSFDLTYDLSKDGQASDLVKKISAKVVREPVDAALVLGTSGQPVFQKPKPGREVDPAASVRAVRDALKNHDGEVKLVFRKVQPKVTAEDLGANVVVDISENKLYLYQGFKVDRTYRVATAAPGYETPLGAWHVIDKQENPTWINPAPNGWGAGEPASIPPGPGNPLGTRAIYLNAPGIRIHGTYDSGSIGTYASHGCIRMNISDVEALYPHVPVGASVLIVP